MSLCLTLFGLSLEKTSQALKDLYNICISHQQIANYCKTVAICVKSFVDNYNYQIGDIFTADETLLKSVASRHLVHHGCRKVIHHRLLSLG